MFLNKGIFLQIRIALLIISLFAISVESFDLQQKLSLSEVVPIGDSIIAFKLGYEGFYLLSEGGMKIIDETNLSISAERYFSPIVSSVDDEIVLWCSGQQGESIIVLDYKGYLISQYGPYNDIGYPAYDSKSDIYFTLDGELYINGDITGLRIESKYISVSPSGTLLTYTDRNDYIHIVDLSTEIDEIVWKGRRYYAPTFITDDTFISPSLEGEIWLLDIYGTSHLIAEGSHPSYLSEHNGILFIKSEDDGYNITSSDIWFTTLDGDANKITNTQDIYEVHPYYYKGGVMAVDTKSGELLFYEDVW